MSLEDRIQKQFRDSIAVKQLSLDTLVTPIQKAALLMSERLKAGNKIMSCGNGGSAADAQHFSAELLNRFERERAPLAGLALTTDSSTLTSVGNDYSFNQVFSKQVMGLGIDGDVLLARVEQAGAACHTGRRDCFYWTLDGDKAVIDKSPLIDPSELYKNDDARK